MATSRKDFNRFVQTAEGINVITPAKSPKNKPNRKAPTKKKVKRGK